MRVASSVRAICKECRVHRRHGVLRVTCKHSPKHKQRQG